MSKKSRRRKIRLALLSIVVAIVAFVVAIRTQVVSVANIPVISPLAERILQFDHTQITQLAESSQGDATGEVYTLAERAQTVGEHAGTVLGVENLQEVLENPVETAETAVAGDEETDPLHQRALEYGKYMYCQEVVREYEEKQ